MSILVIWKIVSSRKRRAISSLPHFPPRHSTPNPLRITTRPISELLSHYTITLVHTEHDCEQFLLERVSSRPAAIGLDCEWVNRDGVDSAPVALLQLAFPSGQCLLVRIFKMSSLGPCLTELLCDKRYADDYYSCSPESEL